MTWELRFFLTSGRQSPLGERVCDFLLTGAATAVTLKDASSKGVFSSEEKFVECQIIAHYPPDHDPLSTEWELRLFLVSLGVTTEIPLQWLRLEDQDWQEGWKAGLAAQKVGDRFLIVPTWITPEPDPSRMIIRLDPQMAFGSGSHATTQGCLVAMEERAALQPLGDFLDLGTGSGILSVAAAQLRANSVTATDLDPIAVSTSQENYRRNFQEGFPVFRCLETSLIPRHVGSAGGKFHTVTANILASVLLDMLSVRAGSRQGDAPGMADILNPGGHLILSGILVSQEEKIVAACRESGLEHIRTRSWEEWSVVTACKPNS
ncbi:MAG: 50S ribosomal protein L11 methyltransferase [Magnetococcales bacterium]|nr:50S ribosomal protein L11 methyltransferase [Magnetococcales bacterium]